MEFLDFDQWYTETRVIPLIPLILGWRIRFWCWNYVWDGVRGVKSKMATKNNKYTPGTHWYPKEWCLQGFQMHCGIVSCLHDSVISNQCKWWFTFNLKKVFCMIQDYDQQPSWIYGFLRCGTETWELPLTSLTSGWEICSGVNKMLRCHLDVRTKMVTNQQLWESKNLLKIRITQLRLLVYIYIFINVYIYTQTGLMHHPHQPSSTTHPCATPSP